jgi:hypothetical protein
MIIIQNTIKKLPIPKEELVVFIKYRHTLSKYTCHRERIDAHI